MPASADPVALFTQAVAALNAEDWTAAALLCDPVSLRAFHRQLLEQLAPDSSPPDLTPEDYVRLHPDMPREVAEYHVAEHLRHADRVRRLHSELPGVPSVEALRELEPVAVFAIWLEGRSVRRQIERLAAAGRIAPATAQRQATAGFDFYRYVALGAIPDGEHLAHVLYRHDVDPTSDWQGEAGELLARRPADEQALLRELSGRRRPLVVPCRRQPDGSWRLLADYDFLGVGSVHIASVREEDAGPASEPGTT